MGQVTARQPFATVPVVAIAAVAIVGLPKALRDTLKHTLGNLWWRLDIRRARRYPYVAAIHDGVVLGIWAIHPAGWRA